MLAWPMLDGSLVRNWSCAAPWTQGLTDFSFTGHTYIVYGPLASECTQNTRFSTY